jgi:hypothetical protein
MIFPTGCYFWQVPPKLRQPGSVFSMSTGFRYVLALNADGSVAAFGNDANGQVTQHTVSCDCSSSFKSVFFFVPWTYH